jgi:hypothetical protein
VAISACPTLHFTDHLPGPMGYPEPRSLVPSGPDSGLTLGSLPVGGLQWLPAPTSDGPGEISFRVRCLVDWGLAKLDHLLWIPDFSIAGNVAYSVF